MSSKRFEDLLKKGFIIEIVAKDQLNGGSFLLYCHVVTSASCNDGGGNWQKEPNPMDVP